jgi:hypothetical protein
MSERDYLSPVLIGSSHNKYGVGAQYIAPKILKYYLHLIYETDHLWN